MTIQSHTNVEICKKVFSSKFHLNSHLRTHTKEKLFVCPTCNRGFALKNNLQNHQATHSKEKPRKFLVKDVLRQKIK